MKKYIKITVPLIMAVAVMIGVPYIYTPGSCGVEFPIAFTGAILGCGGDKIPATSVSADDLSSTIKSADVSKIEKKTGVIVTFVELGSENCMPCRMMKPVIEKLKTNIQHRSKFYITT